MKNGALMMSDVVYARDRVKDLCQQLKKEALAPAELEAKKKLEAAESEAKAILDNAKAQAAKQLEEAKAKIEKEKQVYQTALRQARQLALQALRQEIEEKLFSGSLVELLDKPMKDPVLIARMIQALVAAVDREGLSTQVSALVPKSVSLADLKSLLEGKVIETLKGGQCIHGEMAGGVKVKLEDKKMSYAFTDDFLVDILSHYLRADFREKFLSL